MERRADLERFLAGVERRAFRMARLATRDPDEALDLVQDAMTALVQRYSTRPEAEWRPLFYRILQNRIRDWARRRAFRAPFRGLLGRGDTPAPDPGAEAADPAGASPAELALRADAGRQLDAALQALPLRQRQAFLLRAWEGLDVAEAAHAMGCSTGSVKTHYFRAIQALRAHLGDGWGDGIR
ncbi:MAG: RNA polymerase sigma factor [Deltaproteobacteria bacterium]|nr:RNA polymerase sigma factor [Deltaproteobacteria bacterium]